ncbi:MAG: HEPN domain-containing protein [Chloroflexota bacterium]|nr:HEPN domain-containing protein [Chloroflexota bacterium]
MTEDQRELLLRSRDSLTAAKRLLANGFAAIAASRGYYAMFYVAQAFLEGDGMAFSKLSGVIAAFGQHFANTGRVPRAFNRILIDAEDLRITSDYGREEKVTTEQAEVQIAHAEEFLEVAERMIGPLPSANEGTE